MQRKTENDNLLSEYFRNKSENGVKIPYMTQIAIDTNISIATISRFAKRKGFYNFAEMRAHFNLSLGKDAIIFNDYGLIKFLKDTLKTKEEILIIPSNSTRVIGYHLRERLNEMNISTNMRKYKSTKEEEFNSINKNTKIILISLSSKSAWYESFVDSGIKNSALLIATEKPKKISENTKQIILSDFGLGKYNKIEKNKTVRSFFEWIDDALTEMQIGLKNENLKIHQ